LGRREHRGSITIKLWIALKLLRAGKRNLRRINRPTDSGHGKIAATGYSYILSDADQYKQYLGYMADALKFTV